MSNATKMADGHQMPQRPAAIVVGAFLLLSVVACSDNTGADNASGNGHDTKSGLGLAGPQLFGCDDGSKAKIDFLADGLVIDLTLLPKGRPARLTAPATGLTYIGDQVNVAISSGYIAILRTNTPALICRRIGTGQQPGSSRPP